MTVVVGMKVDFLWYSIGTGDFFHSFFSTICVNLENGNWGSKFPIIMKDLYGGLLENSKLEEAKKEIKIIEEALSKFSPNKVVWDAENLNIMPPWGENISRDVTNLSNYFVTSDGENLIKIIETAINEAILEHVSIEVKSL